MGVRQAPDPSIVQMRTRYLALPAILAVLAVGCRPIAQEEARRARARAYADTAAQSTVVAARDTFRDNWRPARFRGVAPHLLDSLMPPTVREKAWCARYKRDSSGLHLMPERPCMFEMDSGAVNVSYIVLVDSTDHVLRLHRSRWHRGPDAAPRAEAEYESRIASYEARLGATVLRCPVQALGLAGTPPGRAQVWRVADGNRRVALRPVGGGEFHVEEEYRAAPPACDKLL